MRWEVLPEATLRKEIRLKGTVGGVYWLILLLLREGVGVLLSLKEQLIRRFPFWPGRFAMVKRHKELPLKLLIALLVCRIPLPKHAIEQTALMDDCAYHRDIGLRVNLKDDIIEPFLEGRSTQVRTHHLIVLTIIQDDIIRPVLKEF